MLIDIGLELASLEARLAVMIEYLDLRRSLRDWHGVQDAASDIREIEAQIAQLKRLGAETEAA